MPGPGDRGKAKEKPKNAGMALKRLLKYLMKYGWVVLAMLACAFASNIGNLLGPKFAGMAIDEASKGAGAVEMDMVIRYGISMLIAYVSGNILSFIVNIGMMRVGRKGARNMRRNVFNKLIERPAGDFDRRTLGGGEVLECRAGENSKKLLCSQVKVGARVLQICSGIRPHYTAEDMVGKKVLVLTNLKPRKMAGLESQGMLLAAETPDGKVVLMAPEDADVPAGAAGS